ncbi:hypothetical protein SASPL_125821 [Salvia splendens]|uniref:Reverse transcriptase domain-containing protein n=1 Tax=Salvia splendens TaxID=180675 RepID=A0A8X8XJ94_SALSN|nr:hypothetical protein SASPL_125821 [Salvia splendens]
MEIKDFGGEVSSFILKFFDTGKLPNEINHTWVTLIPKVDGAIDIKDFQPISIIGSIYKIIAKNLAKRIANVLPELISETQSAFVKNRKILDGALIAKEVVWWLKKTRQKAAILKLDFQKAYDTVRWDFLEETLVGMGFGRKWIIWIIECVRTASMSILVNGSPTSSFHLQRGLRQEDSLSPFLFLLVAETFSRLVCRGKDLGILKGVDVGIKHIPITHLQFAEDTIIFTPTDFTTLENYKKLLKCFELLSGIRINYGKSVIIPINCEDEWIEGARNRLECEVAKLPVTYLVEKEAFRLGR